MDKDTLIQYLLKKVEELTSRVKQSEKVEEENKTHRDEIAVLKVENAELKVRLNSNSHNSNKPPSSDGYNKKPAFPKKKGGRQGGQKGHKGHTLQQVENPDKIVSCTPMHCTCGHEFKKDGLALAEKRQVSGLPQPELEVTEYQIYNATCPLCGLEHRGATPEGVNAPVQYGNKVKAFAVLLNVHFKLPYKKI